MAAELPIRDEARLLIELLDGIREYVDLVEAWEGRRPLVWA